MTHSKSIVFLDLDGTFWLWGEVPASAQEAVARARASGHKVLCNTGRSRGEVDGLERYELDGGCYSAGADVEVDGQALVDERMPEAVSRQFIERMNAWGFDFNLEGRERSFARWSANNPFFNKNPGGVDQATEFFSKQLPVESMTQADFAQIYKFCVFGNVLSPEHMAQLPEGLTFTDFVFAGEVTWRHITKATAMEAVRSHFQQATGTQWRTIAFGDSDNDIPMLRAADVGVCMGNGNKNAKQAADYITAPIEADGLLQAFNHLALI